MKQYPIAGVGAVVIYNSKVLLVQRGTQPYKGQWCIPGGKINFGETLQQAAEREIFEETGILIEAHEPVYTFDIIETGNSENPSRLPFHYVVTDLRAEYLSGDIQAGSDVLDAAWFGKEEVMRSDVQELTRNFLERWWIKGGPV